jgi:primosomal protein N' (replication factor Y)
MAIEKLAAPAPATAWVEVAVALPVPGLYTYALPVAWAERAQVGVRVRVPFGKSRATGYVVGFPGRAPEGIPVRPLEGVEDGPAIAPELCRLLLWAAEYYLAPPGEMIRAALPPMVQARVERRVRLVDPTRFSAGEADRRILSALAQAEGGELSERALPQAGRALARLAARGAIERQAIARPPAAKVRREPTVALARPASDAERTALSRSRGREALYQALERAAGAELALSALRELPRARVHAQALAKLGLCRIGAREVVRDPFAGEPVAAHPPPALNPAQALAVGAVEAALLRRQFCGFLLHGVTGSGKTEVYLRTIASARARGRGAIVLVPEISLTPQLAARFRARFGDDVAVLHSGLSDGERYDAWRRLRDQRVGIALGARSAVFAPVADVGVIVVDEEHDPSFKQEEGVRYHARDLALVRAQQAGAVALLGSATPALETLHNATVAGRLTRLVLPERATPRPLPAVEIVDLKVHRADRDGLLSAPLDAALAETVAAREQAILFLNRRGFATFLLCRACGHAERCRDCSVALTLHRGRGALVCHYCGRASPRPVACGKCGARAIAELGVGTERVEAALAQRFPDARVARLDRDTGGGAGLRRLLGQMARREIDILVGTQMVTKGHDFPGVTLVGVLLADGGLHLPDFRSAERTFQLLEQVAGRAGRGDRPGRVLIQTYSPDHVAIACARSHDYEAFARAELAAREELGYPPVGRLVALRLDSPDADEARELARALGALVRDTVARLGVAVEVLGPAQAPIARIRGRSRWQLLLRGRDRRALRRVGAQAVSGLSVPGQARLTVDVDPMSAL